MERQSKAQAKSSAEASVLFQKAFDRHQARKQPEIPAFVRGML